MSRPALDLAPLDLPPSWFDTMFAQIGIDAQVKGVRARSIGTGQIGENVRFELDYSRASPEAPPRLVGKFPSADEASLLTAKLLGHYRREVFFYRHFPDIAGRITPHVLYTDYDEATNRFVLIMEDMAPARQGDQLAGCTPEMARIALAAAAKLHAAHWMDTRLDGMGWLQGTATAPPPALSPDMVAGLWDGFKARYTAHLDAGLIEVGDAYAAVLPRWGEQYQGPFALTHNDFRLDNMLFGGADPARPVAVVDWQTVGKGAPAGDVAYFLGAGLTREARPQHEHALLRHYHDTLLAEGVRGYGFEDLYKDYRWFSFYGISVAFGAAMLVKQTERGDEMFLTMLRRHVAQVRDNDGLALLAGL